MKQMPQILTAQVPFNAKNLALECSLRREVFVAVRRSSRCQFLRSKVHVARIL